MEIQVVRYLCKRKAFPYGRIPMKNKITLKQKLIIYFAGMLLLALSIQAIFNYLNSSKLIVEQVKASSNKSLKNMQEEIYSYINGINFSRKEWKNKIEK